jgi:hypothetical protein
MEKLPGNPEELWQIKGEMTPEALVEMGKRMYEAQQKAKAEQTPPMKKKQKKV